MKRLLPLLIVATAAHAQIEWRPVGPGAGFLLARIMPLSTW